jgi:RecA-family ATPase
MGTKKLCISQYFVENFEPKKPEFVFNGLKKGSIGFLVGAGGAGKSMFALQLAISLADNSKRYTFKPFVSPENQGIKVAYMSLEDDEEIIAYRAYNLLKNIKAIHKLEIDDIINIDNNLSIYPLYGKKFRIETDEKEIDELVIDTLKRIAKTHNLIIIDTFSRFKLSDENDNARMAQILTELESVIMGTECSILIVHHANKASLKEKSGQEMLRGASALIDNSRLTITMQYLTDKEKKAFNLKDENEKSVIKVEYSKVNYSLPITAYLARGYKGFLEEIKLEGGEKNDAW